jgi:hypothetical protein
LELIITAAALLLVIIVASIVFYRKILQATMEYEDSKESIRNITFGFTRQLNRLQKDITKAENDTSTAKEVASNALRNSSERRRLHLRDSI